MKSGNDISMRFLFAFLRVSERNGDIATIDPIAILP
jgi:hypothetical protein